MKTRREQQDKRYQINPVVVQKIREGDIDAFETLFRHFNRILVQFAYRYVKDITYAENIVQDVFMTIFEKRENLDPLSNIKTYLFIATKNKALKVIRKNNYEKEYRIQHFKVIRFAKDADEEMLYKKLDRAFHRAIGELPDKCRLISSMNRFDELSYSEIASILGISKRTVETQIRRALIRIRKKLSHYL